MQRKQFPLHLHTHNRMNQYFVRRLLLAIPTILAISFIIFAVLSLAPNDPLSQFAANPAVPAAVRENIRHSLGLDQPCPCVMSCGSRLLSRKVIWAIRFLRVFL